MTTLDQFLKGFSHILPRQGWSFHIDDGFSLFFEEVIDGWGADLPVLQIDLVSNQQNNCIEFCVLLSLFNPAAYMLKSEGAGEVKDD